MLTLNSHKQNLQARRNSNQPIDGFSSLGDIRCVHLIEISHGVTTLVTLISHFDQIYDYIHGDEGINKGLTKDVCFIFHSTALQVHGVKLEKSLI